MGAFSINTVSKIYYYLQIYLLIYFIYISFWDPMHHAIKSRSYHPEVPQKTMPFFLSPLHYKQRDHISKGSYTEVCVSRFWWLAQARCCLSTVRECLRWNISAETQIWTKGIESSPSGRLCRCDPNLGLQKVSKGEWSQTAESFV